MTKGSYSADGVFLLHLWLRIPAARIPVSRDARRPPTQFLTVFLPALSVCMWRRKCACRWWQQWCHHRLTHPLVHPATWLLVPGVVASDVEHQTRLTQTYSEVQRLTKCIQCNNSYGIWHSCHWLWRVVSFRRFASSSCLPYLSSSAWCLGLHTCISTRVGLHTCISLSFWGDLCGCHSLPAVLYFCFLTSRFLWRSSAERACFNTFTNKRM